MADEAGAPQDPVSQEPVHLSDVLVQERAALGSASGRPSEPPLSALCISGGGIRSATFALGALQELGRLGLLTQFDYLSTVSGGGYIGSWLSAWVHRAGDLARVIPRLTRTGSPAASAGTDENSAGADPVEHLREFNSYLTPRLGLLSGDTWTLIAIVVRNLLLNWLLLIPLLMAELMAPRILVSILQIDPPGAVADPFPWFDTLQRGALAAALALYAVSTFNGFGALPSMGGRSMTPAQFLTRCLLPLLLSSLLLVVGFWWAWDDFQRKPTLAELTLAGAALSFLSWIAHLVVFDLRQEPHRFLRRLFGPLTPASVVFGLVTGASTYVLLHVLFETSQNRNDPSFYATLAPVLLLGGILLGQVLAVGFTSRILAEPDREWIARSTAYTLLAILGWLLLSVLVLVIPHFAFGWGGQVHSGLATLGALAGWLTSRSASGGPSTTTPSSPGPGAHVLALAQKAALPVFILVLMLALTMLTNWVLFTAGAGGESFRDHHDLVEHTGLEYALGLTAGFLVVSLVIGRYININTFSLHAMYRDRLVRAYLAASNTDRRPSPFTGFDENDNFPVADLRGQRPLHVLNLTLNLVSGRNLAWQQRKAESFTVSPWHAGSRLLGYRDSAAYGGPRGISLGTAMTISGAAASPNMGYNSSPLVSFTMMLFNARLGWWLGNPGPAGRESWRKSGPGSAVAPVVRETLGLTDDQSPYCYLSDGGHFENLALYEMVLRGCHIIVVLDGGCDPDLTYEDLGNALRKIRIDFGIPIDFEEAAMKPLLSRTKRCALGRIRYSALEPDREDGWLVYVKPLLLGTEAPDVRAYASSHPTFPHESTANQWFNESQTESYRMLGQLTVGEIGAGARGGTLARFVEQVATGYLGLPAATRKSRA